MTAQYQLALALAKGTAQVRASVDALVARLSGECAGVLAGVPREGPLLSGVLAGAPKEGPLVISERRGEVPPLSERARGEAARRAFQRSELKGELNANVVAAQYAPFRQAIAAFTTATSKLRWSHPTIAQAVRYRSQVFLGFAQAEYCEGFTEL